MGDVDDRHAPALQFGDDPEQDLDLRGAQRRRRFIHDEDADILRHRLGDLHDLLLADPEILDEGRRVDVGLEPVEDQARPRLLRPMVDPADVPGDLAGGEDVLGHGQVGEQIQFLEDDADAPPCGVGAAAEHHRLAVDQDASRGRLLNAGDDLHQRRFAGAIFTDQHVDGPAAHGEVGMAHGDGAGIHLRHALQAQDHVRLPGAGGCRDRGAHGAAPSLNTAGVTSGVSPGLLRGNTPVISAARPTRFSRGNPESTARST